MNLLSKILAGIILILLAFLAYQEITHSRKQSRTEAQLQASLQHIDSIETAKTYFDTIHDTVWRSRRIVIKDPTPVDSFRVYADIYRKYVKIDGEDTLIEYKPEFVYDREYDTALITADFELPIVINVRGKLNAIRMSEYKLFKETVNTSHVVNVPKPVITEERRSHLYIYGSSAYVFDSDVIPYEFGLTYMHQTIWGLSAGFMRFEKNNMIKGTIHLKLL